ncbi:MAG: M48 family metalloprotease [Planctomycetota bacterium]
MPQLNSLVTPLTLGIAYAVVFVLCLWVGRAQRREVGASLRRLVAVAAFMALLMVSPAIPPLLFGEKIDLSWAGVRGHVSQEQVDEMGGVPPEGAEPDEEFGGYWVCAREDVEEIIGAGYLGWSRPMNVLVMFLALVFTLRLGTVALRPVRRALREHGELPKVTDPAVLANVQEIAERMHTKSPRVLRLGSISGSLTMQAAAGGTVSPVMIATDGVLDRLESAETSAILAHEMGHIVRRSIWFTLVTVILIEVMTVVASGFLFASISLVLGYALMWAWVKIHGQFDEPACDLRAARAVGFVAMANALDKIHAANSMPCGAKVRRLFHATQTHPSAAVRLQHLARHAPAEEASLLRPDAGEAALQHRTNRIMFGLFALVLAFGIWAGFDEDLKWYGVGALVLTVLAPWVLVLLACLRRLVYARRIGLLRLPWQKAGWFLLLVGCVYFTVAGVGQPWAWPTWPALVFGVWLIWRARRRVRLQRRIRHATRTQDFQEALRLCDLLPRRPRRAPGQRYTRAMLLAADGEDDAALNELESLARDHPRYWAGQLLRCTVTSWRDRQHALEIANQVAAAVPHNPHPLAHQAGCLGWLRRFDEAKTKVQEAIQLDPEDGTLYGLHAAIAIHAGELEVGEELVRETEKRDPGSTLLFLSRARLLLTRGDLEAAGKAVEAAEEAVSKNRMSLLMYAVRLLRQDYGDVLAKAAG